VHPWVLQGCEPLAQCFDPKDMKWKPRDHNLECNANLGCLLIATFASETFPCTKASCLDIESSHFTTFRLKLTRQGCDGAITIPSPMVGFVTPSGASRSK